MADVEEGYTPRDQLIHGFLAKMPLNRRIFFLATTLQREMARHLGAQWIAHQIAQPDAMEATIDAMMQDLMLALLTGTYWALTEDGWTEYTERGRHWVRAMDTLLTLLDTLAPEDAGWSLHGPPPR